MELLNKSIKSVKNLKNMETYEILLFVVLVLYLVSGVSTPYNLAPYVNNVFMYGSLLALVVILYLYTNPILALFFAFVAYVFYSRSQNVSHVKMAPSTQNKTQEMKKLNKHLETKTLEEELVGQIVRKPDNIPNPSTYQPVLCSSHNSSDV